MTAPRTGTITDDATEYPLGIDGYGATGNVNTLYLWGFSGETVSLQARPLNDQAEWFVVQAFTEKTEPPFTFIGRASGYRLLVAGADGSTAVSYAVL